MPPLRVLHLICPTGYYGAERWVLAQARHLPPARVEAHVAATREGDDPRPEILRRTEEAGLPAHEIRLTGRFDLRAVRRVAALAEHVGADLLHPHGYKSDLLAVLAGRRIGRPVLSTPHGFEKALGVRLRLYLAAGRWALRRCDLVAPLATELATQLEAMGVASERIHLVENGVDLSEVDRALVGPPDPVADPRHRPDEKVVAYVGRLAPLKNLGSLVDAFALAARERSDLRLVLVGEGPEESALRKRIAASPVPDRIELLGYREDRLSLLRHCRLFAMTSRHEGIPRSMMEAMALGLPAVAYRIPGTERLVLPGRTGELAAMDDAPSLARAMLHVLDDEDRWRTLARAAAARIRDHFSAARMATDYVELYEELAGRATASLSARIDRE
jgi:glycosyltransferase involved in cell wall biosynthesis